MANSLPILGIAFLGWEVFPVMVLFWAEILIVALYTIAKILSLPSSGTGGWVKKILRLPLFILCYGFFIIILGLAVFVIFGGYHIPDRLPSLT